MRDFDEYIKFMDDVVFYSRYVDDIIIVFVPKSNTGTFNYYTDVEKYITNELNLLLNTKKTIKGSDVVKFDFLGYKFNINKKIIELSDNKVEKYMKKIDLSFSDYDKRRKNNEKKALLLLKRRVKYLTSNTRLANNKRNIIIGIYFSNSILNDTDCLVKLDNYLRCKLCNYPQKLKKLLEDYSFVKGYKEKIFHRFLIK
jgi:hypothetical protein